MAYEMTKVEVWSGPIKDRPGGVAEVLEPLAAAGATLEFVLARRDKRGSGLVFVAPLKGTSQNRAAKAAGLSKSDDLQALRLEGSDKAGLGARICRIMSDAGINMRGLTAVSSGRKAIFYMAFDTKQDVAKARHYLDKSL